MTATDSRADPAQDSEPNPQRWRALAVCLVGGFMVLLDVSIVNVALPSIRIGLHASQSDLGFAGSLVAVHLEPRNGTAWATLVPLLIAGLGGGLVISPNQTLTLSQVPVARAGTAGGLLQTGQRIGAAIGIAAVGAAFFARVAASRGRDFAGAYERGIYVAIAFVLVALVIAVVDIRVDRGRQHAKAGAAGSGR